MADYFLTEKDKFALENGESIFNHINSGDAIHDDLIIFVDVVWAVILYHALSEVVDDKAAHQEHFFSMIQKEGLDAALADMKYQHSQYINSISGKINDVQSTLTIISEYIFKNTEKPPALEEEEKEDEIIEEDNSEKQAIAVAAMELFNDEKFQKELIKRAAAFSGIKEKEISLNFMDYRIVDTNLCEYLYDGNVFYSKFIEV